MINKLWLAAVALLVAGCGEQNASAPAPASPEIPATVAAMPPRGPLPAPDLEVHPDFGIATRRGILSIGQSLDQAYSIFAEPPGSFEQSELPPSISAPFEARGWQKQGEGFGAILYNGRVAGALYQLDNVKGDRVDEFLTLQRNAFGKEDRPLISKHVSYWFWNRGKNGQPSPDVLMVCASELSPGLYHLSISTGTRAVMQALGMSEDAASRDSRRTGDLLEKQKG